MALNYDWSRTPEHAELDPQLKYIACMSTMAVGVGDLSTPKGFAEYVMRLRVLESLVGSFWTDGDGNGTLADHTEKFRGLRTNVSTEKRASWLKRKTDEFVAATLAVTPESEAAA